MELPAFQWVLLVAYAHDLSLATRVCPRRNSQFFGQSRRFDDETVVSSCYEWVCNARKKPLVIVLDVIGFSVHQFWRADDACAKCLTNRLVP